MNADCDLLVTSTDRFLPEAMITIGQLKRLGLASQFDCHLLLGDENPVVDGFKVLRRRQPGTWSSELRDGLNQLSKPYVLLWLDDFPPLGVSGVEEIMALIGQFVASQGNYLRLNPTPAGHGPEVLAGTHEVMPGELYRTSTVYAVWRRELLLSVLDDSESAWQFEFAGSVRSDCHGGFMASDHPHVDCVNLVIKGLIDPRAEARLREAQVDVSGLVRPRMTAAQLRKLRFGELRSRVLRLLPWQLRSQARYLFSTNPVTRR
jgi:hypothetical protein